MARRGRPQVTSLWSFDTFKRISIHIEGIVQGVGFRPFIYRLAHQYRMSGWVMNTPSGVVLEVQGLADDTECFLRAIPEQAPPLAVISSFRPEEIHTVEESGFIIRESGGVGSDVQIAPDCDVCPDCLGELFDPADRRYRYPFINCTNCGPRYTIIKGVPYDRAFTTMAEFPMCDDCRAEYEDPSHRRFHAQPNACPVCGPSLDLLDSAGVHVGGEVLDTAISLLKEGKILALKGLGGYHLAVDACNNEAVGELRRRKKRDEKPFALMSPGLEEVAEYAVFSETEKKLLCGPERPIVLLGKRQGNSISPLVAPANGYFGVMLPYTPLHHLLLRGNFNALVMTSGNLSDEPISYLDDEALGRLSNIADFFLTHNREIHTRTDDSVIRVFRGNPIFLRRSRGYVPRSINLPGTLKNVLAVGAELKGAVCLTRGDKAFLSQHIGDLQNASTLLSMEETVGHLERILKIVPEVVAFDMHPDYLSTVYAQGINNLPKIGVQHHHAHLASCMAENALEGDAIGVIFDGTGYGPDGTVWGGEFLVGGYTAYRRKGHFRATPLPGGDSAVREPYRMALSYLYAVFGDGLFDLSLPCMEMIPAAERKLFLKMLEKRLNSPLTSSCGRLFDAVAALIGLRGRVSYEGQAAIELEALAESSRSCQVYPFKVTTEKGTHQVDFGPMIRAIVDGLASGRAGAEIARSFHNTVGAAVGEICGLIRKETGLDRVVLSGGVFQNKLLSEGVCDLLAENEFHVFTQRLAPPNDGGIALGQAIIAGRSNICV
jgi:hydrogenase maturation protein HypF